MAEPSLRILVTGASGMLGKDVVAELVKEPGFAVFSLVRNKTAFLAGEQVVADLQSSTSIAALMQEVSPDFIIHCAALTDLDQCERERETAYRLNVASVQQLVDCKTEKCRFIYVSTDSVFNGNAGSYSESDRPEPLNYYAESKYLGERAAHKAYDSALVLRTNLYGYHMPRGKSLVEWALDNFSRGQCINGFDDVFFNPLFTIQLAKIIRQLLLRRDVVGTIHLGTSEYLSKFEFLQRLAVVFGYDQGLVTRTSSDTVRFKVRRPLNTTLNCSRLQHLMGSIPSLNEGLELLRKTIQT